MIHVRDTQNLLSFTQDKNKACMTKTYIVIGEELS